MKPVIALQTVLPFHFYSFVNRNPIEGICKARRKRRREEEKEEEEEAQAPHVCTNEKLKTKEGLTSLTGSQRIIPRSETSYLP